MGRYPLFSRCDLPSRSLASGTSGWTRQFRCLLLGPHSGKTDQQTKKPPGWEASLKIVTICAQSKLLPTPTSSSIIMRSPMSTRLIIMVLGSNVEFTDRLPFLVLYKDYDTTLPLVCQYPSRNFKVRQSQSREITSQLHFLGYSTTSICSGSSTMISGAP